MTALPDADTLLARIRDLTRDGEAPLTRRDLADDLGVKGDERRGLRALLSELAEQNRITIEGRRIRPRLEGLPPVAVLDIDRPDEEGDLLCIAVTGEADDTTVIRLPNRFAAKERPALGPGDRVLARLARAEDGSYTASPIKRLGRGATKLLGVYRQLARSGIVEPVSRKAGPSLTIREQDRNGATDGQLVWAEPVNERGHGPNRGRVREIVGGFDEKGAWSLLALAEQDIPVEFPADVLAEAEAQSLPKGKVPHEDLKDKLFITIDPKEARDHDDAVLAEALPDGGYRVSVAIADVSWFVRPGSKLDREAEKRGNSVYLIDRVVPMLPEVLSNDLCSLNAKRVRPTLVCEMEIGPNGQKRTHRFRRAMIKCVAGLSYEEAQAAANGNTTRRTSHLKEDVIDPLWAAWRLMVQAREQKPPLELDLPERQIILSDQGHVERVATKDRLDAHRLIETMMVAANVCAAETLEKQRETLIYRIHDQPNPERVDALRVYLQSMDYSLPKGQVLSPQSFNRVLEKAGKKDELHLVSLAILRTQMQAIYSTENLGHFGLNLARYAHFTSPIRRYADLTVHRALVGALHLGQGAPRADDADRLSSVAEHISTTERRAQAAERATSDRYLASYLEGQTGSTFAGRVNGVTRAGLFITLDGTGADGFVPMRSLYGDYYEHDEDTQALVGRDGGGRYHLGQHVEVRLLEVTPVQGGLRFEMLTPPDGGSGDSPSPRGARGRRDRARPATGPRAKRRTRGVKSKGKPRRDKAAASKFLDAPAATADKSAPAKPAKREEEAPTALKRRPRKATKGAARKRTGPGKPSR